MIISKCIIPYVIFGSLAFLIMMPLFSSGFIFSLDGSIPPEIKSRTYIIGLENSKSPGELTMLFLDIFDDYIPSEMLHKLLLFSILFISAASMYKLIETTNQLPRYFAALLYMVNPFVYLRFMAGHTGLLISYAIFPFVISSIIRFFAEPSVKQTVRTSFWFLFVGIQIQYLQFAFFVMGVFYVFFWCNKCRINHQLVVLFMLFFLLLNSYWLLPLLAERNNSLESIDEKDLTVFSTNTEVISKFTTVSMMYGFWRQDAYILPTKIVPKAALVIIFFCMIYLCVLGFVTSSCEYRTPILVIGIISMLLALGTSHFMSRTVFTLMFRYIPFFKALREPNKCIGLLIIMYCYLAAHGFDSVLAQVHRQSKIKYMFYLLLIIPLVYTPTMFGSFWSQINPSHYPADWYQVDAYLNNDTQEFNVLVLPWHMYMDYTWINNRDRRVSNLARNFFDKPMIIGDNVEIGTIFSDSASQRSKYIQSLVYNSSVERIGHRLKILNVKYVLLTKDADFKSYLYLLNQSDLELVINTTHLYLFRNMVDVNKLYQSDHWILEPDNHDKLVPLGYAMGSSINYRIHYPESRYVIFTEDYSPFWKLGSQKPSPYGPVNVYLYSDARQLFFHRSYLIGISYGISCLAFACMLIVLFAFESSEGGET